MKITFFDTHSFEKESFDRTNKRNLIMNFRFLFLVIYARVSRHEN